MRRVGVGGDGWFVVAAAATGWDEHKAVLFWVGGMFMTVLCVTTWVVGVVVDHHHHRHHHTG